MTTAFSAKLAATAVAVTVVAGGVLVANIDAPRPAAAAGPLGTTLDDARGEGVIAFQPQATGNNPLAETQDATQPELIDILPQPLPQSAPVSVISGPAPDVMVETVPSQQLIHARAVEYERTRDETLIDIEYQRAMAEVMQMKAEAKQVEAQAMGTANEEQETLLNRSREFFAIAESREYEAEAAKLTAQADLLERRLTALGAPFRDGTSSSGTIEPGDRLTIRLVPDPDGIWGTRILTVSPEGSITLPYVGEQPVAGLEFREFVEKLVKYYTVGNVFDDPVFEVNHTRPEIAPQAMPESRTYQLPPESSPFSDPEPVPVDPPADYSDPNSPNVDAASGPNEEPDFQPLPIDDSDAAY